MDSRKTGCTLAKITLFFLCFVICALFIFWTTTPRELLSTKPVHGAGQVAFMEEQLARPFFPESAQQNGSRSNIAQIKTVLPLKLWRLPSPKCSNVLQEAVIGKWEKNDTVSKEDLAALHTFLRDARRTHSLPDELQRPDKLCGNVTFKLRSLSTGMWFRALCDPNGDTPCCYNNRCTARSEETCRCKDCYDLRQPILSEFATWKPLNPSCQLIRLRRKSVCSVLENMKIYFIGDSFMRHIYISVLNLLRQGTAYGVLRNNTSPDHTRQCNTNDQYLYLKMCTPYIDSKVQECQGSVKLELMEELYKLSMSGQILKTISSLKGEANSLVLLGIGIHDNFNFGRIQSQLLQPLVRQLSGSPWPHVVWSAMHAPGLLKSPSVPAQLRDNILLFNSRVQGILEEHNIPMLKTFNISDGCMSHDGAHFGKGVNDVKAQIFLNYVLEFRKAMEQKQQMQLS